MKKIIYCIILLVFLMSPIPAFAATTMQVTPGSGSYSQAFTIAITINSDTAFNAAAGNVSLSNISVSELIFGNCGFSFVTTPTTSNPSFTGVILGGSSKQCTVYTMTIKPTTTGPGGVAISNASVKEAGTAQELLSSTSDGSYSLTASVTSQATLTPTTAPSVGGSDAYTLNVKVVSDNSVPSSNSQVVLQPQSGDAEQPIQVATNQDGVATLDNVPAGVYTLSVTDDTGKKISDKVINVSGNQPVLTFGVQQDKRSFGGVLPIILGIGIMLVALVLFGWFFFFRKRNAS